MARQRPAAGDMEKVLEKLSKLDILETKLGKLEKLDKLEDKLDGLQRSFEEMRTEMAATKKDLNVVQMTVKENKERVESLEGGLQAVRRRDEERGNVLLNLQVQNMAYFLRFQNVEEELDQEDLRDVMVKLLGEYIEKSSEYMDGDIDQIYRVNSLYARTHAVPREVHIKFVKRGMRDEILRRQRDGALIHKGKEVTILKQVPRQVRELRKKYYFLSNKLYLRGIGFRWLIPEGLMIFWEGARKKITTVDEAKAYMEENKTLLDPRDTGTEEGEIADIQEVGVGTAVDVRGEGRTEARVLRSKTKK